MRAHTHTTICSIVFWEKRPCAFLLFLLVQNPHTHRHTHTHDIDGWPYVRIEHIPRLIVTVTHTHTHVHSHTRTLTHSHTHGNSTDSTRCFAPLCVTCASCIRSRKRFLNIRTSNNKGSEKYKYNEKANCENVQK